MRFLFFCLLAMGCSVPAPLPEAATSPDTGTTPTLEARLHELVSAPVGDGVITVTVDTEPQTTRRLPSVVVAVVAPGFRGVLTASAPGNPPLDGRTVLPLSSITKVVTALIASQDVVAGRFSAEAPLSTLLRPDVAPLVGDRTVLEVVSHTAGFATNPRNLAFERQPHSPATGYSRAALIDCLKRDGCALGPAPRGRYQYSNLGIGVLGVALADFHRTPFAMLLEQRVTGPLGLRETGLVTVDTNADFLEGRTPAGERVRPATMGVLEAAGAMTSTADDMLRFLDALLAPPPGWGPVLDLVTRPATPGAKTGWAVDRISPRGIPLLAKSGGQAGYSSMLMWSPTAGVGVVALSPAGDVSTTLAALCVDLLEQVQRP